MRRESPWKKNKIHRDTTPKKECKKQVGTIQEEKESRSIILFPIIFLEKGKTDRDHLETECADPHKNKHPQGPLGSPGKTGETHLIKMLPAGVAKEETWDRSERVTTRTHPPYSPFFTPQGK
ncbi:hypothetical protein TNCV_4844391 [Trichonephila clavipes]|uniref:Uncharacterized protein n=1 Tax=Trichonephila clavipes TaxID=2585209 RepID=A0A8X6WJ30_TRICX|nr:hypothetical protein TNCV_4844391 [Trichonephila clavipes]